MNPRTMGLLWILFGSLVGGCTGFFGSSISNALPTPDRYAFLAEPVNLPHHVPQFPGGVSLRFSMVHDVLHERFPKHGKVWYEERNRQTNASLAPLSDSDPGRWPLIDDLAVAYDRLGRPADAIPLLRSKLQSQEAAGISGQDLYTTLANLGTVLIHASAADARLGDAEAVARFDEGIRLVRRSVEVNPGAHFGREKWQSAIAEFMRAVFEDPSLLKTFDCLGNRLDLGIQEILDREQNWVQLGYGRPTMPDFSRGSGERTIFEVPKFFESAVNPDDPSLWTEVAGIRQFITRIGAEHGWDQVDVPSYRTQVPFDEPVLGMIGMWRQGGGANPHFALALGETMLRVGQRYIAWTAFERASLMAERYSPDPELQIFLRNHCAQRQSAIEESLRFRATGRTRNEPWQYVSPPPEPAALDQFRAVFQKELTFGQKYQQEYQAFEEARIAEGHAIDEEDFFDDFFRGRRSIASPAGGEETAVIVRGSVRSQYTQRNIQASSLLGAGAGAMLVSVVGYIRRRWKIRSGMAECATPD